MATSAEEEQGTAEKALARGAQEARCFRGRHAEGFRERDRSESRASAASRGTSTGGIDSFAAESFSKSGCFLLGPAFPMRVAPPPSKTLSAFHVECNYVHVSCLVHRLCAGDLVLNAQLRWQSSLSNLNPSKAEILIRSKSRHPQSRHGTKMQMLQPLQQLPSKSLAVEVACAACPSSDFFSAAASAVRKDAISLQIR